MPVFLVSLLWLLLLAFPTAARAFPACGYYKLSPDEFLSALDAFANDVQAHIQRNPELIDVLAQRGNITQSVYDAGLIEQVPGCVPDSGESFVEVVGGDPLEIVETTHADWVGFSLIVRGLTRPSCQAILDNPGRERPMRVRPEVPGRAPGTVGDCIENPVVRLLTRGRRMPMPNTAYVYQRIVAKPQAGLCPIAPADQLANLNAGKDGPCVGVKEGRARPDQEAECTRLTQQIRNELDRQNNMLSIHDLEGYSIEQRLALIRPLFVSYFLPQNPPLFNDRQRQVTKIFTAGPEGNVDAVYWAGELNAYHRIGEAVQQIACKNHWATQLTKPYLWVTSDKEDKKRILNDVYLAFKTVKPIQVRQLHFVDDPKIGAKLGDLNAMYVPDGNNEYGKDMQDSIMITQQGYLPPFALLKDALEVLFEELMHAHQYEVQTQYMEGTLPQATHACVQAAMFAYNLISRAKDPDANVVSRTIEQALLTQYKSQPVEYHAKKFAKLVTGQILDEASAQCPQQEPVP
jgi:hypothetical protein